MKSNDSRERLIRKIAMLGLPPQTMEDSRRCPLVSLEDFFEGNNDPGSIGCNLRTSDNPGITGFFHALMGIRNRPNVQDVLVEISEMPEDETTWPFSDRIYIITSAEEDEVKSWMDALHPDEVGEGFISGIPPGAPPLRQGMRVYGVWWD